MENQEQHLFNMIALPSVVSFIPSLLVFFTTWALVAHILYYYKIFPFNTFLLSFIVSVVGFCLTYIYPRRILFRYQGEGMGLFIDGYELVFFDLLFHQLPMFLFLQSGLYKQLRAVDIFYCYGVLLTYVIVVRDPLSVYQLCGNVLK